MHVMQITHNSGVETTIEAFITQSGITWVRSERMQFYDGETWSVEQTISDYITSGPPGLVSDLSAESKAKIDGFLNRPS